MEKNMTPTLPRTGRREKKAIDTSAKALGRGAAVTKEAITHEEDWLKPLREVLERVVELAQLVEGYELEPSEVDLTSIIKELTECKGRIQSLLSLTACRKIPPWQQTPTSCSAR
jgi:hypothetical protein